MVVPVDILCFSHLRWDDSPARLSQLLARAARVQRVYLVEPAIHDDGLPRVAVRRTAEGVIVVTPHVPGASDRALAESWLRKLIDRVVAAEHLLDPVCWYVDPMAIGYTGHLASCAVVYDCLDDRAQVPGVVEREEELLRVADVVFTAGHALFQARRAVHRNVHPFPSSVDVALFAQARGAVTEPADQAAVPHPRAGFAGTIDERLDLGLVDAVAALCPDLHLVMVGPIAGIDEASLPRRPNLHWLGAKARDELPAYLAGWDVGIIPFAETGATLILDPTLPAELLAAGKPVVSTSVHDIVRPYGEHGLAWIGDSPDAFLAAIDNALAEDAGRRRDRADAFLDELSWDRTWSEMWPLIQAAIAADDARDATVAEPAAALA